MGPRVDAILALLLTPFVITVLVAIVCAVLVVARADRADYMAPWRDRETGDLP